MNKILILIKSTLSDQLLRAFHGVWTGTLIWRILSSSPKLIFLFLSEENCLFRLNNHEKR